VKELVQHVMVDFTQMKSFAQDPLILTEGDGIWVTDIDGHRYIDGLSGTFCLSLGHNNRALIEAGSRQLGRLAMATPTMGTSDRALELAQRLLEITPPEYTTMKILSGGSEATEAAIKMARQFHRQDGSNAGMKYKILSHYRGFHGATGFAVSATGWPAWKVPYEPFPAGFVHLPTPDAYRPSFGGETLDEIGERYANWVEEVIELEGPSTIAAFITEPVLMSAGTVVPPVTYLKRIRELCDRYDIVLIFDEIITGFGRVGAMFAAELWDVWPDILVVGKGISSGYAALSAVILKDRLASTFWGEPEDNVHFHSGHTYGGNPVACAIGLATLDQLRDGSISANSRDRGDQARARLRALQERLPAIGDVRGVGLLVGIEFVQDPSTRERFPADQGIGIKVRDEARKRGLLMRASHWMAVLAPPLTTTAAEMDDMLDRLEESLIQVLEPLGEPSKELARTAK
jgi:adenosylmethionine-8-amino-7-oxononanoate aminotransferase